MTDVTGGGTSTVLLGAGSAASLPLRLPPRLSQWLSPWLPPGLPPRWPWGEGGARLDPTLEAIALASPCNRRWWRLQP